MSRQNGRTEVTMAFEFRLPDLRGSEEEQIKAIRSYLYQLVPELAWAMNSLSERIDGLSAVQEISDTKGVGE